jgi:hypothetical protein
MDEGGGREVYTHDGFRPAKTAFSSRAIAFESLQGTGFSPYVNALKGKRGLYRRRKNSAGVDSDQGD